MYKSLLRFGFRLLYNELAFSYDTVSWLVSRGEWHAWQRTALRHLNTPPGSAVLELAHGTANLQRDLQLAGFDAVGIDLSRAMGRIARRKLSHAGIMPHLAQADVRQLPFAAGQFPVILTIFPSDYIADPAVIAEIYRVLAPDGRLVVVLSGVITGKQSAEAARTQPTIDLPWPEEITKLFISRGFTLTSYAEPCTISFTQLMVASKSI